jgi:F0F1-type ATP synthase membrane subunit c/vacuolar-type H+-ATPase subunit K
MNQSPEQLMLDARYRVLVILWFAMLGSVVMFFVITKITGTPKAAEANMTLVSIFMALGLFTIGLSFVLKRRLLSQAIERQRPDLVQTGLIVGMALCEAAAIFGLIIFFVTGYAYYYLCFIVSLAAMLLHFPRREHLRAASFKSARPGFMMQ